MTKKSSQPPKKSNQASPLADVGVLAKQAGSPLIAAGIGVFVMLTMLGLSVFIPNPTQSQLDTFRIFSAIGAAGIGSVIPGIISVNFQNYVRAGGAIALFVIVYFFNPPQRALDLKKSLEYGDLIRRGDAALAQSDQMTASDFYLQALALDPEQWTAYNGLARSAYDQGRYLVAQGYFKTSFEKGGKKDGTQLYSLGLTHDALGQYQQAAESFAAAVVMLKPDAGIANNARFLKALMEILLWLSGDAPRPTAAFNNAEIGMLSYIQYQQGPPHWADYHLACLYARRSQDSLLTSTERKTLIDRSASHLKKSIEFLAAYPSVKAPLQKDMMNKLLADTDQYQRKASLPARCGAVREIFTQNGGAIDGLLAQLR